MSDHTAQAAVDGVVAATGLAVFASQFFDQSLHWYILIVTAILVTARAAKAIKDLFGKQ